MSQLQTEKPVVFGNYIAFGLLLGMCSLFFQIAVGPYGPYGVIYQYLVVVALSVVIPWLFLRLTRRMVRKNIGAVFGCLYGAAMFGSMPVLIQAVVAYNWHYNVPHVERFAATDFASVDKDGDAVVTYAELDAIDQGQCDLKAQIEQLKSAKRAILTSGATTPPVQKAVGEIELLIKDGEKHLLPEQKLLRIQAVKSDLHQVGHIVAAQTPGKGEISRYGVTSSEIATYGQRLNERYHYWFVAFGMVGLIDR